MMAGEDVTCRIFRSSLKMRTFWLPSIRTYPPEQAPMLRHWYSCRDNGTTKPIQQAHDTCPLTRRLPSITHTTQ
jgi:hypothetical protein